MDVFKFQLKLIKYCGITRFPSKKMKYVFKFLKGWNVSVTFYCIFSSFLFLCTSKDILSIAESMAPTTTALITIVKYIIFALKTDEFFDIMEEINKLNEECKNLYPIIYMKIDQISEFKILQTRNYQTQKKYYPRLKTCQTEYRFHWDMDAFSLQ